MKKKLEFHLKAVELSISSSIGIVTLFFSAFLFFFGLGSSSISIKSWNYSCSFKIFPFGINYLICWSLSLSDSSTLEYSFEITFCCSYELEWVWAVFNCEILLQLYWSLKNGGYYENYGYGEYYKNYGYGGLFKYDDGGYNGIFRALGNGI